MKYIFKIIALNLALLIGNQAFAESEGEGFDAAGHAIHHALDAHEIHFTDDIVIPLPVILWLLGRCAIRLLPRYAALLAA